MISTTKSLNFIFVAVIFCNNYVGYECYHNPYQGGNQNAYLDSSFRFLRYIPEGMNKGAKFGWQNPIRVAPTLPPVAPQSDPVLNTEASVLYPRTEKYVMTRKPSTATPDPRNTQCRPGSRLGRHDGRCHTLGSKGSCNENMAFYAEPTNEKYGQCDCLQNVNRPLVYHRESDKCYFVFQQAFCENGNWLVLDSQRTEEPFCDPNRCINWTADRYDSKWDWKSNRESLEATGPVAILNERTCAVLGWPCNDEGTQKIKDLLPDRVSADVRTSVRLRFDGANLVCSKLLQSELKESSFLECKPVLFNKWRNGGNCQ